MISDGKILRTGSSREILNLASRRVEKIDLRKRAVIPGLTDSHIHLGNYAMMLASVDLSNVRSITSIKSLLKEAASKHSSRIWILGRGWDQEKLREKRYPNKHDLEPIPNPVFIRRVCGHIGVANSTALSTAGIVKETADPEGGVINRERGSNEPNGILKERAIDLITRAIPRNKSDLRQLLPLACKNLLKMGLTSLHCIIEDITEFAAIKALKREGKIVQTIYPILPVKNSIEYFSKSVQKHRSPGEGRSLKIYLDGSLGARTASLSKPYNDDPDNSGMLTTSHREFLEIAESAKELELQLCIHAIGDNAVHVALQTLKQVFGAKHCKRFRHRIEHASLTSAPLRSEMRQLGVIASVQPRFIYSDTWAAKRLGNQRAHQLYAFKSMLGQGIPIASGSDCPVENPDPFEGIWSAVTRPDMNPNQVLTVNQALETYTRGPAYASFSESNKGSLDSGKTANMLILDRDIFECRADNLSDVKVVSAITDGLSEF